MRAAALTIALVVAAPIGFVVTIALFPLWAWIEETYGIESVGHSGPATWCYAVTVAAAAAVLGAVAWRLTGHRERQ